MHCICASSGVSQYHLNGFVNAYVDAGGTLQDLDLFRRSIIWPPGSGVSQYHLNGFANAENDNRDGPEEDGE